MLSIYHCRPQRSCCELIFSGACVKNSVWGVPGQVPLWARTPKAGAAPGQVHPPGRYTPPGQVLPPGRYSPWEGTPPPPSTVHAGRYGQQVGGTHPTGMQSFVEVCFKSVHLFVNIGLYFVSIRHFVAEDLKTELNKNAFQ